MANLEGGRDVTLRDRISFALTAQIATAKFLRVESIYVQNKIKLKFNGDVFAKPLKDDKKEVMVSKSLRDHILCISF